MHCPTTLVGFDDIGGATSRLERGDLGKGRMVVMYD